MSRLSPIIGGAPLLRRGVMQCVAFSAAPATVHGTAAAAAAGGGVIARREAAEAVLFCKPPIEPLWRRLHKAGGPPLTEVHRLAFVFALLWRDLRPGDGYIWRYLFTF